MKKLLSESIGALDRHIKEDRRTQAAVSDARQEAILRLVSSTLTDNMEDTLRRIVNNSIQASVVPAISDITLKVVNSQATRAVDLTMKTVNEQLGSKLTTHLNQNLSKELHRLLPDAVSKALHQPQLLKLMAESLAKTVAFRVEEEFSSALTKQITPAFTQLAVTTSQKVAADVHRQAAEQIGAIERQRHADSIKIEQLTQLVTGLTNTVSSMAAAQTEFQGQFLRMQQSARDRSTIPRTASQPHSHSISRPSTALTVPVEKSAEETEFDEMFESIQEPMNESRYEDAVVRWLQTGREQEFFRRYFSRFSTEFISTLSPLLLLSLGAIITLEFTDEFLEQRLAWTEVILANFQAKMTAGQLEPQVSELVPKIMGIYTQRLEHLLMRVSNVSPNDPTLKRLHNMVIASHRILDLAALERNSPHSQQHYQM